MKAMKMKQLAIFLENKPGILAKVCKELSKKRINILALTVSDTVDHAVVRMVVSNHRKAMEILEDANLLVIENDVFLITLKNRPGELGRVAAKFGASRINIEYAYGCVTPQAEEAPVVFRVSDSKKAMKLLK